MEEHRWADEGHCGVGRGCTEVAKSDSRDVHLSVLKVLPDVIRESVDAEQHSDYKKGEDGIRGVKNGVNENVTIHRLYGAVNIDGKTYRVKVTLKEYADKNEPSRAYSYEATKIELLAGTLVDGKTTDPSTNNSITAANLLQNVEKSYGNGTKLLDSSKVVDENGEPMVVYHGSGDTFTIQKYRNLGKQGENVCYFITSFSMELGLVSVLIGFVCLLYTKT